MTKHNTDRPDFSCKRVFSFLMSFILLMIGVTAFPQKDTLFLFKDCDLIGDSVFNRTINGNREGHWIEFITKSKSFCKFDAVLWSGVDSLGNDANGIDYYYYKYEPLSNFDSVHSKMETQNHTCSDGTIILQNWLPPDFYFIAAQGIYEHDQKQGLWKYFYEDNRIKKAIEFDHGKPINTFDIYNKDGSLMMRITALDEDKFEVCRFNPSDTIPECTVRALDEILPIID